MTTNDYFQMHVDLVSFFQIWTQSLEWISLNDRLQMQLTELRLSCWFVQYFKCTPCWSFMKAVLLCFVHFWLKNVFLCYNLWDTFTNYSYTKTKTAGKQVFKEKEPIEKLKNWKLWKRSLMIHAATVKTIFYMEQYSNVHKYDCLCMLACFTFGSFGRLL